MYVCMHFANLMLYTRSMADDNPDFNFHPSFHVHCHSVSWWESVIIFKLTEAKLKGGVTSWFMQLCSLFVFRCTKFSRHFLETLYLLVVEKDSSCNAFYMGHFNLFYFLDDQNVAWAWQKVHKSLVVYRLDNTTKSGSVFHFMAFK